MIITRIVEKIHLNQVMDISVLWMSQIFTCVQKVDFQGKMR